MPDLRLRIVSVYRGFTGGTGFVSRLIRRLDRVKFTDTTCRPPLVTRHAPVINHVYRRFVFDCGLPTEASAEAGLSLITESHFTGGVQITPHAHLLGAIASGRVTHCYEKPLDLSPCSSWCRHAELHGDSYDTGLILSYWAWLRLGRRRSSKRFERNKKNNRWTCNEYYVATAAGIEPDIPEPDLRLTPEALFIKTFGMPSACYEKMVGTAVPCRPPATCHPSPATENSSTLIPGA